MLDILPPGDATGVLTAIVSAALFTLAIFFVVRSRQARTEIETPLTMAAFSADWLPMARDLFGDVVMERRNPALGLMLSVALHLALLVTGPLIPYIFPAQLPFDFRRYQVKLIEFRIPTPLVYTADDKPKAERSSRPRSREGAAKAGLAALRPKESRVLRPFQLAASAKARTRDVVLQPDQPPQVTLTLPQNLPATFLWAQAPAPPRETQTVGAAPNQPRRPALALPDATPRVQPPNLELNIADVQIAANPVLTFHAPNLPAPASNVAPLTAEGTGTAELPPTAMPAGTPVNMVALMQNLAGLLPSYLVDLGNRMGEAQAASGGRAGGTTTDAAAGANGRGLGGSGATTNQAELLAGASGAAGNGGPAGTAAAAAAAAARTALGGPTGHLGIVVVHQTANESAIEGAEALTGQPVYTVFFDVPGSPRRWVLQYCLPGAEAAASIIQSAEGHVRVMPRRSVQPPYPLERIPVDLRGFKGETQRLVVYGFVNEKGEVLNLRVLHGTGQEVDKTALATLGRWAFRPALKDDQPVAVEAIFGIPLQ
jgi:hypothetical protein